MGFPPCGVSGPLGKLIHRKIGTLFNEIRSRYGSYKVSEPIQYKK